jgi:release factor glutamine methyltransferase
MNISFAIQHFTSSLSEFLGQGEALSCARITLEKITGIPFNSLKVEGETELSEDEISYLDKVILELKTGRPLQYILNEAWFYNLPFFVDDRVLIPRPETEELVNIILKPYDFDKPIRILDIGTGSGCIPVTIAYHKPHWKVFAIDISKDALDVAVENAAMHNVSVQFQMVDVLNDSYTDAFFKKHGKFDIIVSNPPYITFDEKKLLNPNVLNFEPHSALFADEQDALIFYRRINQLATKYLNDGGQLYYEINEHRGKEMLDLMKNHNFNEIELIKDINEKNRIIKAVK